MSLCHIAWISEAVKNYSEEDLLALLKKSRAHNALVEITGLLLYHQGSFMQFMEGAEDTVMATYNERILPSRLHRKVTLLLRTQMSARIFSNWSMGFMATDSKLARAVPGFMEFVRTRGSFLELAGDSERARKLIDAFHAGRWHLHNECI